MMDDKTKHMLLQEPYGNCLCPKDMLLLNELLINHLEFLYEYHYHQGFLCNHGDLMG